MRIIISESQLGRIISETYGELEKHYLKPGIFDDEDRDVIMNITGGDNWTKLIADMYKYLANKYNPSVEPKRLNDHDVEILRNAHAMLKRYNKNVFPLKDIFAKDYYTHPLGVRNDLALRELIISKLKNFPSILLRNLKGDIRKERNEYEFKELWDTIRVILIALKLLNNVSPEKREIIIKKIFSSKFTTFEEVKDRIENTTIPYLSEESGLDELIDKVNDMGDEAEIIYNKDNILAVVIKSPEAMRYIGCSSQWCFATGGDDYWDQYASEGYATIIFNFDEDPSSNKRMVVSLDDGSVYDMYNEQMDDGDSYLISLGVFDVIPIGETDLNEGFGKENLEKDSGFIYHGTGKGQAFNIQKDGYMKTNKTGEEHPSISFSENLNYAKYYATVKGGQSKMVILRTKLTDDFILSPKISNNKGDEYVTFNKIPTTDIEILCPDKEWRPLDAWDVVFDEPKFI